MGTPSTLRLAAGALSIGPFIASIRPLIQHGQGFFKALLESGRTPETSSSRTGTADEGQASPDYATNQTTWSSNAAPLPGHSDLRCVIVQAVRELHVHTRFVSDGPCIMAGREHHHVFRPVHVFRTVHHPHTQAS